MRKPPHEGIPGSRRVNRGDTRRFNKHQRAVALKIWRHGPPTSRQASGGDDRLDLVRVERLETKPGADVPPPILARDEDDSIDAELVDDRPEELTYEGRLEVLQ